MLPRTGSRSSFSSSSSFSPPSGSCRRVPRSRRSRETKESAPTRSSSSGGTPQADRRGGRKVGGWRTAVYSNSLQIVMGVIFLFSWGLQSVAGNVVYNDDQAEHGASAIPWTEYLGTADFWNRTLQNWQSEFLAVGCMVAFSIYLRQRGSAESKPVGTPHEQASIESE